jgi:hypothetical protein
LFGIQDESNLPLSSKARLARRWKIKHGIAVHMKRESDIIEIVPYILLLLF